MGSKRPPEQSAADPPAKKQAEGCPVSKADFLAKAAEHTFKFTLNPKEMSSGSFGWSKAGGRSSVLLGEELGNAKVMCSGPTFNCIVVGSKDGTCGMTAKEFMKAAEPKEFEMSCLPYEFSTGSLGWEGDCKQFVTVGEKTLHLQCQLNCPILNSNQGHPEPPASAPTDKIDFGTIGTATIAEKDDLKKIKGIGPFIEQRLHGIGIFTFKQLSLMTPKIEEEVNEAIEYFPGRVRRDEWVAQATQFAAKKK